LLTDAFLSRESDGLQRATIQRFMQEQSQQESFLSCTNVSFARDEEERGIGGSLSPSTGSCRHVTCSWCNLRPQLRRHNLSEMPDIRGGNDAVRLWDLHGQGL